MHLTISGITYSVAFSLLRRQNLLKLEIAISLVYHDCIQPSIAVAHWMSDSSVTKDL